jgi:hypothetical protein
VIFNERDVSFPVNAAVSHTTDDPRNPRNSCIRLHRPIPMTLQWSLCGFVVLFPLPKMSFSLPRLYIRRW